MLYEESTGSFKINATHKSHIKNYGNAWKSIFTLKYYKHC